MRPPAYRLKGQTLHIADMLKTQPRHISFHTPGHKRAGADITELSYSDCLAHPEGVLAAAERDIAKILGAAASFILTDGSTSGVFAMVYALRAAGATSLAVPAFSHPSVWHACGVMGIKTHPIPQITRFGIPQQPQEEDIAEALAQADALLLTSPDYYGNFPPLAAARRLADGAGKPLLLDGAHGAHLHFGELYAGRYADLWVDGVHKSLPALTQGAVVSAKEPVWAEKLKKGVLTFRTTSPSYPVMASVEYAVKYPRNLAVEEASEAFKRRHGCLGNRDWSKILIPFASPHDAQRYLEARGVYPEFNDGNYLMFYLSPCTKAGELKKLGRLIGGLPLGEVPQDAPAGVIPMYSEEP